MHNNSVRKSLSLGAALTVLCVATPVFAQASAEANAGDIIVTARRVEERLQDVPISITVFNQQQLNNHNILSGDDLAKVTSGLTSNSQFGSDHTAYTIRGFKQDLGTAPTVGVYFADVVAPRGGSSGTFAGDGAGVGNFFDLQNVQVLKGPQGTLQGRNTTGGAIMLVPQKPTDRFEGYVEGDVGNFDAWGFQAVLNAPISDSFKLRLGVDRQKRDGYLKNVTGIGVKDFNDVNYLALRLSAVADLTPDLENYTIVSFTKSDTHGTANKLIAVNPNGPLTAAVGAQAQLAREAALGFYTASSIMPDQGDRNRTWQVINTATWKASDTLTIKNIVSYAELRVRNNEEVFASDFNLGGAPIYSNMIHVAPGVDNTSQSTFTEEFRFQGNAMDGKLRWQAGAYYETSKPLGASGNQTVGFGYCPAIGTSNGVLPGCYGLPQGVGVYNFQLARTTTDDKALYGQFTYNFTEKLSLTGGFRYTWDKMKSIAQEEARDFANNLFCIETFSAPTGASCPTVNVSQKSHAPTWLVDVDFKPINDLLLYAKYSRGYRAGGVKNDAPNMSLVRADLPNYAVFNPEKLDSYEVGLKSSFHGAINGTFNLSAYYNKFSNQQISLGILLLPNSTFGGTAFACTLTPYTPCPVPVDVAGVPTSAPINLGRSRIYGLDADLTLSRGGFTVSASYSYVNSKVNSIQGVAPIVFLNQSLITNAQAKVGFPLAYAPEHKLVLNGDYTLPLPESVGELTLGATFTYTSSYYTTFGDTGIPTLVPRNGVLVASTADLGLIPSTSLLDLSVNWKRAFGSPVDLAFWATNVTGKKYLSNVSGTLGYGFDFGQVAAPRLWGFKAKVHF